MINMAILLGRVGKKDVKTTKNGTSMVTLSLATTKNYTDSDGIKQKQTTWHFINCFSRLADNINKYTEVGDLIHVTGEICLTKVNEQNYYSVHAQDIKFIQKGNQAKEQTQVKITSDFNDDLPF